jgi:hypothetical protein
MTTLIAVVVAWICALIIWFVHVVLVLNEPSTTSPGMVKLALVKGAPLLIAIPLIYVPLLRWLRRKVSRPARL